MGLLKRRGRGSLGLSPHPPYLDRGWVWRPGPIPPRASGCGNHRGDSSRASSTTQGAVPEPGLQTDLLHPWPEVPQWLGCCPVPSSVPRPGLALSGPQMSLHKSMPLRGKPATLSTRPPGHQIVGSLWQSFLNWTLWVPFCSEAGGSEVQDLSKGPEAPDRSPRPASRITPWRGSQPTEQEWLHLLHRPCWGRSSQKMSMLSPLHLS